MRTQSYHSESNQQGNVDNVQCKLTVGTVKDPLEAEADAVADHVMRMPENAVVQRKCSQCEEEESVQRKPLTSFIQKKSNESKGTVVPDTVANKINSGKGGGNPLSSSAKTFMESRFDTDFSDVRVHTDSESIQLSRELNAQAFTVGSDIYFNEGKYSPESEEGKHLLAHELTHTIQQGGGNRSVQRVVELRPPGRGEASAFERRQEIVDRLNLLSDNVTYTLNERVLAYNAPEGATLSFFDQQMVDFIDSASVLPMRLITGGGLVGDSVNGFSTLLIDSFLSGYVDVDDLMRSDDLSFQMNILHILRERASVSNYARRIGSPGLSPVDPVTGNLTREFRRAHRAGINAEVLLLREVFSDATIRFRGERTSGDNVIFTFRSDEGYRVRHTFRRQSGNVSGGTVVVINAAGDRVTVEDFLAQRAAAAVAP